MFARKLIRAGVFSSAALALIACASSDEPTKTVPDASFSSDASADAAKPKPGSDLPVVTLGGGTTASMSGPVKCGSKMCTAPAGGMIMNVACCLPDGSCGAKPDLSSFGMGFPGAGAPAPAGAGDSGGCLDVSAGKPDTSCPSQSLMGFALAGCCSNAGVCGIDLTVGGLGCNPVSALGALASIAGGGAMDAGPPQACGGGAGNVDASAAVLDAAAPAADASSVAHADAATSP